MTEREALLEKALDAMIVRQLELGDCPYAYCPHDATERPEDSVCMECWRNWALEQAEEAADDVGIKDPQA